MITALVLAAAAFFAGQWTAPERIVTVPVYVPVPVECRETVPPRPVMPTEQFSQKPGVDQFTQAAMAELEIREGYETDLRHVAETCTKPLKPAETHAETHSQETGSPKR